MHWEEALDSQIAFDKVLREDPAGAYSRMDFDSRDMYRARLVKIAEAPIRPKSWKSPRPALALARNAKKEDLGDPRQAQRQSHIGFYLIGPGQEQLHAKVGLSSVFGLAHTAFSANPS